MDESNRKTSVRVGHADRDAAEAGRAGKHAREAERKKALDDSLERGLEESFPGSDPVAATQPPHSLHDRHKS
jgi:hypothetical protein